MKRNYLWVRLFALPLMLVFLSSAFTACKPTSDPGSSSGASAARSSASDPADGSSADAENSDSGSAAVTSSVSENKSSASSRNASQPMNQSTESKAASEADLYGKNYSPGTDSFYQKKKIHVTWLNVWCGSTEPWFNGLAYSNYGPRIKIGGDSVVPDANKASHRNYVFNQAKSAGINALVMDLTNGHSGWNMISKDYQRMCYENGMKFAAATHPKGASDVEEICKFIWETYAAPGKALYASSYLYKNGKPLMVMYSTKGEYDSAVKSSGAYRSKFEFVWASGEDSEPNKWGWQLEAKDGPVASKDSMFITPAISWNSPRSSVDAWRTSLAFLDFGFLAAKENNPEFLIVGSLDDTTEHNGWMTMDTTLKTYEMPTITSTNLEIGLSYQMKDIYGNISANAYYDRARQWITQGGASTYHKGGILADGAYTLTNKASNERFGVNRPAPQTKPATDLNAVFRRGFQLNTDMETYYWFYHLGNNEYKIIKLASGLALQPDSGGKLIQTWSENSNKQRWIVAKQSNGAFTIANKETGAAIHDMASGDDIIYVKAKNSTANQQWAVQAVPGRTIQ